jgi:hypothetical protein
MPPTPPMEVADARFRIPAASEYGRVSLKHAYISHKHLFSNQSEPLNRNESGRFGALKSDSTHHFFRNACTKSGSLRFSQFSGCM